MLKPQGKSPKLRGRGADVRALVPYGHEVSQRLLDASKPEDATVIQMAFHLNKCYTHLSKESYEHAAMARHCLSFCLLAVAMEAKHPEAWAVKPKLHLFQEVCEMSNSCPSLSWCYRDEDMGGSLARMAHRKGGVISAKATGVAMLNKWRARYSVPRFSL